MKPVFIAGPYRGNPEVNTKRVLEYARTLPKDIIPIIPHPLILAGVFGDDDDPVQREAGIERTWEMMRIVACTPGGRLHILVRNGVMSEGCAQEYREWMRLAPWAPPVLVDWDSFDRLAPPHSRPEFTGE